MTRRWLTNEHDKIIELFSGTNAAVKMPHMVCARHAWRLGTCFTTYMFVHAYNRGDTIELKVPCFTYLL